MEELALFTVTAPTSSLTVTLAWALYRAAYSALQRHVNSILPRPSSSIHPSSHIPVCILCVNSPSKFHWPARGTKTGHRQASSVSAQASPSHLILGN